MKRFTIKRILIKNCGPIKDLEYDSKDLNVIVGNNEAGKTFFEDSILFENKLIKGLDIPEARKNILENADINLTLSDENNKVLKFNKDILGNFDFTPKDFVRLFVVRNSDIEIEKGADVRALSEKLIGNDLTQINKIIKNIRGNFLTDGNEFKDVAGNKIKTFIKKVDELNEQFQEEQSSLKSLSEIEMEILKNNAEIEENKKRLEQNENKIKEYSLYKKVIYYRNKKALLGEIKKLKDQLENLEQYEKGKDEWSQLYNDIDRLQNEIEKLKEGLKESNSKLNKLDEEFNKINNEYTYIKDKMDKVEKLKLKSDTQMEKEITTNLISKKIATTKTFATISFIISILAILIGIIVKSQILIFGGIGFALLHLILAIIFYTKGTVLNERERFELEFLKDLSGIGIKIESISEFPAEYERLKREFLEIEGTLKQKEQRKIQLDSIIDQFKHDFKEKEEELAKNKDMFNRLNFELNIKNEEELNEKIKTYIEIKAMINKLEGKLTQYENMDFSDIDESLLNKNIDLSLEEIEKNIEKLQNTSDILKIKVQHLESDRDDLLKIKDKYNEKITIYNGKLKDAFNLYNQIDQIEKIEFSEFLTVEAIKEGINKLNEFQNNLEHIKEIKTKAIEFLEKIREKKEASINDFFGEGKRVSKLFEEITNGRYKSVEYEDGAIYVRDQRGERFSVDVISKGTYDQLFFAIKLAFAESILKGVKGFFLLDDPFIAADDRRFENGMNILKNISEKNWQIFYFSVQTRVKNWCKKNNINLKIIGG